MIYFVLPIYNEGTNLPALLSNLRRLMTGEDYRIVAVNDGSSDDSLEILQEGEHKDLIITGSVINMNVGAVFATGINRALSEAGEEDVLVIMESDQTSRIESAITLIEEIRSRGQDVVIASRYRAGGGYRNFPLLRRIFSYCANYLMHVYFPIRDIMDYTIFFRAYRVGILKKAVTYFSPYGLIQSKGFVANAELLVKLSLFTDRIKEVPYIYDYKAKLGKSKIKIFSTINEYIVLTNYMRRILKKVRSYKKRHHLDGLLGTAQTSARERTLWQ